MLGKNQKGNIFLKFCKNHERLISVLGSTRKALKIISMAIFQPKRINE